MEDVADEVQPGDFARDGRAVHEEGGHDDVNDLCTNADVCEYEEGCIWCGRLSPRMRLPRARG